ERNACLEGRNECSEIVSECDAAAHLHVELREVFTRFRRAALQIRDVCVAVLRRERGAEPTVRRLARVFERLWPERGQIDRDVRIRRLCESQCFAFATGERQLVMLALIRELL